MSFEIGNKIKGDGIRLDDLLKNVNGQKDKQKIISIFERFDTNNNGTEDNILDKDEQIMLMQFFKGLAGEDTEITHKEAKTDKTNKYSEYKKFMKIFEKFIQKSDNNQIETVTFKDNKELTVQNNNQDIEEYDSEGHIKTAKDKFDRTLVKVEDGVKTEFSYDDNNPNSLPKEVKITKDNNTITYTKSDDGIYTDNAGDKYNYNNGVFTKIEQPQVQQTPPPQEPEKKPKPQRPAKRDLVSLPSKWRNQRFEQSVIEELKLNDTYNANEVFDKLIEKFNINKNDIQKDKLLADLIKYNPSVFDKDGNVYSDAIWTNLDFPKDVGTLYKEGAAIPTVQKNSKRHSSSVQQQTTNPQTQTATATNKTSRSKKSSKSSGTKATTLTPPKPPVTTPPKSTSKIPAFYNVKSAGTGSDFSQPYNFFQDLNTGATLNRLPHRNYSELSKGTGCLYEAGAYGHTLYYSTGAAKLIYVKDNKGNKILEFDDKTFSYTQNRYYPDGRLSAQIKRNMNGSFISYSTYKYDGSNRQEIIHDIYGRATGYIDEKGNQHPIPAPLNPKAFKVDATI